MTDWNNFDQPELKKLFSKHLIRTAISLMILIAIIFLLALSLEPQIRIASQWLTTNFGVWGMAVFVFFTDLIVSPIPPDAVLFAISKSPMHQDWLILVPFLGLVSAAAGVCGWLLCKKLQHIKIVERYLLYFTSEHEKSLKRYGFWMVVIGALTPVPFSITCWIAGVINLPLRPLLMACLLRVPRFIIYYWGIHASGSIGAMLRSLL